MCLKCRVDIVISVDAAVAHVNRHSSGHRGLCGGRRYGRRGRSCARSTAPTSSTTRPLDSRTASGSGSARSWASRRAASTRAGPVGVAGFLTYKERLLRSAASHAVADFGAGCMRGRTGSCRSSTNPGCVSEVVDFFFSVRLEAWSAARPPAEMTCYLSRNPSRALIVYVCLGCIAQS